MSGVSLAATVDRTSVGDGMERAGSGVSLSTSLSGSEVAMPIILAPTGGTKIFHHAGEIAVARAAQRAGCIFALSTMSTTSLEDVAASEHGPLWFQLYVTRDRALTESLLQRASAQGYHGLCITVDSAVVGLREHDYRNGYSIPPVVRVSTFVEAARKWRWWTRFVVDGPPPRANFPAFDARDPAKSFTTMINPKMTWADLEWIREQWRGPLILKGIQHPDDAARAVDVGATSIVVSNHGGRQMGAVHASLDLLAPIVERVGADAEVILDGGVRRGSDMLIALALGAKACMIGRPYLYALAAGGEAGVVRMFELLRGELTRNMMLLGCRDLSELGPDVIREVPYSYRPNG